MYGIFYSGIFYSAYSFLVGQDRGWKQSYDDFGKDSKELQHEVIHL